MFVDVRVINTSTYLSLIVTVGSKVKVIIKVKGQGHPPPKKALINLSFTLESESR